MKNKTKSNYLNKILMQNCFAPIDDLFAYTSTLNHNCLKSIWLKFRTNKREYELIRELWTSIYLYLAKISRQVHGKTVVKLKTSPLLN